MPRECDRCLTRLTGFEIDVGEAFQNRRGLERRCRVMQVELGNL